MKKLWAIVCVVGVTAFLTFGFIAVSGAVGERSAGAMSFVLALAGLGAGILGWFKVMRTAPRMHGRRAEARQRMEEDFSNSTS